MTHPGPGHPAVDVLRVLAVSRSTGALELRGEPGGTIYLHEGDVTYAEAPGTPRVLMPGVTDQRDYAAAVRAAILETGLILLTAPHRQGERPLFRPGRRHWTGLACRLGVDPLLREVERRAAGLASLGVGPDGEIRLRGLRRGEQVVLTAEEWEVVAGLVGVATPRALAWRSRSPLTTTVRVAASLVAAGVCAPVSSGPPAAAAATASATATMTATTVPTRPPTPSPEAPAALPPVRSAAPATRPAAAPATVPAAAALPRRAPGATGVPASFLPPDAMRRPDDANRLVAQRLLDGLRRLPPP